MSLSGKALVTYLENDTTLNSLVGGRIRLSKLDQDDAHPAILCFKISTDPSNTKDGSSKADLERWQVSTIGPSIASISSIAAQVRTVLDGQKNISEQSINIDGIVFLDEVNLPYNDDNDMYQISQEFQLRIRW